MKHTGIAPRLFFHLYLRGRATRAVTLQTLSHQDSKHQSSDPTSIHHKKKQPQNPALQILTPKTQPYKYSPQNPTLQISTPKTQPYKYSPQKPSPTNSHLKTQPYKYPSQAPISRQGSIPEHSGLPADGSGASTGCQPAVTRQFCAGSRHLNRFL